MNKSNWVLTAILCRHCARMIYGQQTLRDNIARASLIRGAKAAGGVESGEDWFCCRGCRTAHQISPGVKTGKFMTLNSE